MVTRRCVQRLFLLRPCETTTAIFRYVLAVAAKRYRVAVHAFCVLSNHYHLVLTDTDGRLPDFMRDLGSLVARATNCAIGRWDKFWEGNSYSAVELATPAAVHEKLVYLLANPVAAGLVRHARDWPGDWSHPSRIGAPAVTIARPVVRAGGKDAKDFFDEQGQIEAHVRAGVPFQEICYFAEQTLIQLIVVGTHGRSGLAHLLIGSTAERVVQHARCPVLSIKPRIARVSPT